MHYTVTPSALCQKWCTLLRQNANDHIKPYRWRWRVHVWSRCYRADCWRRTDIDRRVSPALARYSADSTRAPSSPRRGEAPRSLCCPPTIPSHNGNQSHNNHYYHHRFTFQRKTTNAEYNTVMVPKGWQKGPWRPRMSWSDTEDSQSINMTRTDYREMADDWAMWKSWVAA